MISYIGIQYINLVTNDFLIYLPGVFFDEHFHIGVPVVYLLNDAKTLPDAYLALVTNESVQGVLDFLFLFFFPLRRRH